MLPTTLTAQLPLTPRKSSASTPSLSSNQEEDETEAGETFSQADAVPNGHLRNPCSRQADESGPDSSGTDRASVRSADLSEASVELSCSCSDVSSSAAPESLLERTEASDCDASHTPADRPETETPDRLTLEEVQPPEDVQTVGSSVSSLTALHTTAI